ncbi:uncharacterized protein LOC121972613 [Zingiber officinale]|uniref:uncharacterized protein LOC121972613 n=1 Tax=Zingiber officinale TaxID=94328 RepID=UPI001C4B8034|nr:uncharacterized protein LOC121972613 [Zingiber officinale]
MEDTRRLTTVTLPQEDLDALIQARVTKILEQQQPQALADRLDHAEGTWVDKLPSVLWALRMTPKEATDVTPFQLVYSGETVVPVEVGVESDRMQLYDKGNTKRRLMELDLVDESRDKVTILLMTYRQRIRQNYNRRVIPSSFQVEDMLWKRIKSVNDITKLETS